LQKRQLHHQDLSLQRKAGLHEEKTQRNNHKKNTHNVLYFF
jgi:hypothetical protein